MSPPIRPPPHTHTHPARTRLVPCIMPDEGFNSDRSFWIVHFDETANFK